MALNVGTLSKKGKVNFGKEDPAKKNSNDYEETNHELNVKKDDDRIFL